MAEPVGYGRVTWWEIPVPDLEKSKAFYGAVFGWTFQNFGGTYEMIHAEGEMIGALDATQQGSAGDGAALYFNVADMEDTLARVVASGGSVVTGRVEIGGGMGWSALFRDPDGFRIGLWTGTPAKEAAGS